MLIRELRIMSESSNSPIVSIVSAGLRSSSPRDLKFMNVKTRLVQSAITCFSFASMSFSLTAEIQMSWGRGQYGVISGCVAVARV